MTLLVKLKELFIFITTCFVSLLLLYETFYYWSVFCLFLFICSLFASILSYFSYYYYFNYNSSSVLFLHITLLILHATSLVFIPFIELLFIILSFLIFISIYILVYKILFIYIGHIQYFPIVCFFNMFIPNIFMIFMHQFNSISFNIICSISVLNYLSIFMFIITLCITLVTLFWSYIFTDFYKNSVNNMYKNIFSQFTLYILCFFCGYSYLFLFIKINNLVYNNSSYFILHILSIMFVVFTIRYSTILYKIFLIHNESFSLCIFMDYYINKYIFLNFHINICQIVYNFSNIFSIILLMYMYRYILFDLFVNGSPSLLILISVFMLVCMDKLCQKYILAALLCFIILYSLLLYIILVYDLFSLIGVAADNNKFLLLLTVPITVNYDIVHRYKALSSFIDQLVDLFTTQKGSVIINEEVFYNIRNSKVSLDNHVYSNICTLQPMILIFIFRYKYIYRCGSYLDIHILHLLNYLKISPESEEYFISMTEKYPHMINSIVLILEQLSGYHKEYSELCKIFEKEILILTVHILNILKLHEGLEYYTYKFWLVFLMLVRISSDSYSSPILFLRSDFRMILNTIILDGFLDQEYLVFDSNILRSTAHGVHSSFLLATGITTARILEYHVSLSSLWSFLLDTLSTRYRIGEKLNKVFFKKYSPMYYQYFYANRCYISNFCLNRYIFFLEIYITTLKQIFNDKNFIEICIIVRNKINTDFSILSFDTAEINSRLFIINKDSLDILSRFFSILKNEFQIQDMNLFYGLKFKIFIYLFISRFYTKDGVHHLSNNSIDSFYVDIYHYSFERLCQDLLLDLDFK